VNPNELPQPTEPGADEPGTGDFLTGDPPWPSADLTAPLPAVRTCPRCRTPNPSDRAYCWRCLHEIPTTDEPEHIEVAPVVPVESVEPDELAEPVVSVVSVPTAEPVTTAPQGAQVAPVEPDAPVETAPTAEP
jgi:hypothetical protein